MKAHRTDGVSLAFGLLFLAVAAWWLLAQIFVLALPTVGWFLACALIVVGVFGLLGVALRSRSTPVEPPAEAAGVPAGTRAAPTDEPIDEPTGPGPQQGTR